MPAITRPAHARLHDPPALRRLLVDTFGSINQAAAAAGLNQSGLNRKVSKGAPKRPVYLSPEYVGRLRNALPADKVAAFDAVILSPFARGILENYVRWLDAELRPIGGNRWTTVETLLQSPEPPSTPIELTPDGDLLDPKDPGYWTLGEFQKTAIKLRRLTPGLWNHFDDRADEFRTDPGRRVLAVLRVARPLLPFSAASPRFVEMTIDELAESMQLETYVHMAMQAELVLLAREPAVVRAQILTFPTHGLGDPALRSFSKMRDLFQGVPVEPGPPPADLSGHYLFRELSEQQQRTVQMQYEAQLAEWQERTRAWNARRDPAELDRP